MAGLKLFGLLMLISSVFTARVALEDSYAMPLPPSRENEVDAGIQLFTDSLEAYEEPSVRSAGAALVSLAGVAVFVPVEPANVIVAGCLGTLGILMQHFDSTTTAPSLTNTQVARQMRAGFQDITRRLSAGFEHMNYRLDTVDRGLALLRENLGRVADMLQDMTNPNGVAQLRIKASQIDGVYKEYMIKLGIAAQELVEEPELGSPAYARALEFVETHVRAKRQWVRVQFAPDEIARLLGGWENCSKASDLYKGIVSARVQLSTLIIHADAFDYQQEKPGATRLGLEAEQALKDLMRDLAMYHESALEHDVPMSAADHLSCERSNSGRSWSQFLPHSQFLPDGVSSQGIAVDTLHVYVIDRHGKVWQAPNTVEVEPAASSVDEVALQADFATAPPQPRGDGQEGVASAARWQEKSQGPGGRSWVCQQQQGRGMWNTWTVPTPEWPGPWQQQPFDSAKQWDEDMVAWQAAFQAEEARARNSQEASARVSQEERTQEILHTYSYLGTAWR